MTIKNLFSFLLVVIFFSSNNLFADKIYDKCLKMAEKANSDKGFSMMFKACIYEFEDNPETSIINRSETYKCAKKAYKKKTDKAVTTTFKLCINNS